MAPDNKKPKTAGRKRTPVRPVSGKKAALATAAGAIPLVLSMMTSPGKPVKPGTSATAATRRASLKASDLEFHPGCRMPFTSDPVTGIDDVCRIEGEGANDKKRAESQAKNNFCATTSNPVVITYQTFLDLQNRPKIKVGEDRSDLVKVLNENGESIGEGTYVEYVAYIMDAHISNKGKGEAVNCNLSGSDTNDIHIELTSVDAPDEDDPCTSVTAEISPHFRPEAWNPDKLNKLKTHLMRFRGPLFYDGGGSHAPCHDDKRPSPARASVWEIHPVYSVDVCKLKGGKTCKSWVPIEEWDKAESTEDDET